MFFLLVSCLFSSSPVGGELVMVGRASNVLHHAGAAMCLASSGMLAHAVDVGFIDEKKFNTSKVLGFVGTGFCALEGIGEIRP